MSVRIPYDVIISRCANMLMKCRDDGTILYCHAELVEA